VIISGLVGFAIQKLATASLRETLLWQGADPEQCAALIDYMQNMDAQMYSAGEMMEVEANMFPMWLDEQLEAGVDLLSLFEQAPSELREALNNVSEEQLRSVVRETVREDYLALVDYFALPYYEAQTVEPHSLLSDNPLSQSFLPATEAILAQEAATHTEVRGIMLSAAVELYRSENDTYPESLADLVPDYVPELPEDPFSGQPFEYAQTPSSYLLYSVGPDMLDDGGSPLDGSGSFPERQGDILLHGEDSPVP